MGTSQSKHVETRIKSVPHNTHFYTPKNSSTVRITKINVEPIFTELEEGDIPIITKNNVLPIPMTESWKKEWISNHVTQFEQLKNALISEYPRAISSLIDASVPQEFRSKNYPMMASLMNLIAFILSMVYFSWGTYLIFYPSGRKLILDVFVGDRKNPVPINIAVINFIKVVRAIYVTSLGNNIPTDISTELVERIYKILPPKVKQALIDKGVTTKMLKPVVFTHFYNQIFGGLAASATRPTRIAPYSELSTLSHAYQLPFY